MLSPPTETRATGRVGTTPQDAPLGDPAQTTQDSGQHLHLLPHCSSERNHPRTERKQAHGSPGLRSLPETQAKAVH